MFLVLSIEMISLPPIAQLAERETVEANAVISRSLVRFRLGGFFSTLLKTLFGHTCFFFWGLSTNEFSIKRVLAQEVGL